MMAKYLDSIGLIGTILVTAVSVFSRKKRKILLFLKMMKILKNRMTKMD